MQRLACDISGIGRKKKLNGGCDIGGFAHSPQRDPQCRLLHLFLGKLMFGTGVFSNKTWHHAVPVTPDREKYSAKLLTAVSRAPFDDADRGAENMSFRNT